MEYTATCNGSAMKIGTKAECLEYCRMQRLKVKGGGLAEAPPPIGQAAKAAEARWDVRPEKHGDRQSLTNIMDAPFGRPDMTSMNKR